MNDQPIDLKQYFLGAEELHGLLRAQCDFIRAALQEPHHAWRPWLVVSAKSWPAGEDKLIAHALDVPFNEHDEKRAVLRTIGRGFWGRKEIPLAAIMATEAWTAERPADAPHVPPRDCPNRRESIVVFGATLGSKHVAMARMSISRDPDNRIMPGEFEPLQTEGVSVPLLEHLFQGFFEHVGKTFGHPAFREERR